MTGTGYANADYEIWPYFCQLALFILMFFGAMGGSTSGGMKLTRIILLIKALTNTSEIKKITCQSNVTFETSKHIYPRVHV